MKGRGLGSAAEALCGRIERKDGEIVRQRSGLTVCHVRRVVCGVPRVPLRDCGCGWQTLHI